MAKADQLKRRFKGQQNEMVRASLDMANLQLVGWQARDDGRIQAGAFVVSGVGLEIQSAIDETEWLAFYQALDKLQNALQWIIGDWINYGDKTYGKTYADAAEMTGLKETTLHTYSWVAREVEISRRRENLSFSHHETVAGLAPEEQEYWLIAAHTNNWSSKRLREEISDEKPVKPSVLEKAHARQVKERDRVLKKARSKKNRETWQTYAQQQAQEWLQLARHIEDLSK